MSSQCLPLMTSLPVPTTLVRRRSPFPADTKILVLDVIHFMVRAHLACVFHRLSIYCLWHKLTLKFQHRLTRISLSLSLTRIFPTWGTIRRSSRGISVAFVIFFFGAMSWLWTSSCSRLVDATNQPGTNILDCNSERLGLTIANFVGGCILHV